MTSRRQVLAAAALAAFSLSACSSATNSSTTAAANSAPSGAPGQPPGGAAGGSGTQTTPTGAYTLATGSATKSGTITASAKNQSGVLVTGGSLTLDNAAVVTSGASSSSDESSFYGLNAGVLAHNGGTVAVKGGSVTTSGVGANGVFAYGKGAITLDGTTIKATGQYAHGIMASGGGALTATDLTVTTAGGSSAPIATDRGGGTIVVTGGSYRSTGNNSPAIYSTGVITAKGGTYVATGSEVVVVEGANSVTVTDAALTTSKAGKWGVMIYQSFSGDASGTKGSYRQTGGSLASTASDSPLFFVTNSTGVVGLTGVKVTAASGVLVKAAAAQWGTSGSNGGQVLLTAKAQALSGDVVADKVSSVTLTLTSGSTLTGAVNTAKTAKSATVALDSSCDWTVTADSHLSALTGASVTGSSVRNVKGNGHTVSYDSSDSANSYLNGKTYTLAGGGTLEPA